MDKITRLLNRASKRIPPKVERVRLIYADGHMEEKLDTLATKTQYIPAFYDYMGEHERGENHHGIVRVEYQDSGEIWDYEESANKPPMTEEEAEAIMREITEQFEREGRL